MTYSTLDIGSAEPSGEGGAHSVKSRGNRDDIGAVDEGVGLAEELELVHGCLELGGHAGLVVHHGLPQAGGSAVCVPQFITRGSVSE